MVMDGLKNSGIILQAACSLPWIRTPCLNPCPFLSCIPLVIDKRVASPGLSAVSPAITGGFGLPLLCNLGAQLYLHVCRGNSTKYHVLAWKIEN